MLISISCYYFFLIIDSIIYCTSIKDQKPIFINPQMSSHAPETLMFGSVFYLFWAGLTWVCVLQCSNSRGCNMTNHSINLIGLFDLCSNSHSQQRVQTQHLEGHSEFTVSSSSSDRSVRSVELSILEFDKKEYSSAFSCPDRALLVCRLHCMCCHVYY